MTNLNKFILTQEKEIILKNKKEIEDKDKLLKFNKKDRVMHSREENINDMKVLIIKVNIKQLSMNR